MALTLALSYTERNDNKRLTLTDATGTGTGGWGNSGNPLVTDLTGLTLDISITTSDGTTTTYDQIDLIDIYGPFTSPSELVFELDCSDLVVGTTALGTSDSEFPDGIYTITYTADFVGGPAELEQEVFIEGRIRNAVYEKLRTVSTIYNCRDCRSKEIMDTILCYGYLNTMRASAYVAKTEELLNQLFVLERLVTNGSNYTW